MDHNTLRNYQIEFECPRIVLRTLTPDHYSASYLSWLHDPETTQYLEVRHATHTKDNVIDFIKDMLESDNNLQMGIFLKDTNKHIGNIKIGPVNWHYKRADIGLMIGDKESWGKGYATEAITAVKHISFQSLNLNRLQAGAYASNIGSIKAFLKSGFQKEGILRANFILDDEPEDHVLVGALKEK